MPKRVRVRAACRTPDTESWLLTIHPYGPDRGGRYEIIRPGAAAEIIREHADKQRRDLALPSAGEVEGITKLLSARGWRIERSQVNYDEFMWRALS